MNIDLQGKTALVTGASRGIGAAIYRRLGAAGATVVGTATSDSGVAAITDGATNAGFRGLATVYDAADGAQAKTLIAKTCELAGASPDILICNAAINADGLLMRMKDDDWERVLQTNLSGVFYLARAVIADMLKKRGGRIIAISSVVAQAGNAGQTNYVAAKAGVEGFVRALAREAGGRNVTVNAIAPGFINTDMTAKLPQALRDKFIAETPLKRMGEADEVAAAAVFLASDDASYITGQTLNVNGGMLMK
ncbi:MAG: 3-oxoacyl-ACP reductase FabG [Gammaproteobacteria bacterium WSBS_2016_MAG_OTU1]